MDLENKIINNKTILNAEGITEPYINNEYYCETCGNVGKSHPKTSFCFVCGDDNWELVKSDINSNKTNQIKDQTILIHGKYNLIIENIQYSENFPTQVYLCRVTDNCAIKGRNFIKDTPLSTMVQWAENQVQSIEKKLKEQPNIQE